MMGTIMNLLESMYDLASYLASSSFLSFSRSSKIGTVLTLERRERSSVVEAFCTSFSFSLYNPIEYKLYISCKSNHATFFSS